MVAVLIAVALLGLQDTVVVVSDGPGLWGRVELIEEVRIGALDGPEELLFGQIADLEPALDGAIWVFDFQFRDLRIFDRSGRFVRYVGREGQGPGEFKQILGIVRLADGRMATWDPGLARITIYEPSGDYSDSFTVPFGYFENRSMFAADRYGNFYVKRPTGELRDGELVTEFVTLSPSGQQLAAAPLPLTGSGRSLVAYRPSGPTWPYIKSTRHAVSPLGYLVIGTNTTYAFDLVRPGQPILRIERDHSPVRVRAEEREAWEEALARAGRMASRMGQEAPEDRVPSVKPAYRDLYVDKAGRIWVDRYVEARRLPGDRIRGEMEWSEPRTFDVFEPDGQFQGTVELPRANQLYEADGEYLYCLEAGEFGEHYVVRYRLKHE